MRLILNSIYVLMFSCLPVMSQQWVLDSYETVNNVEIHQSVDPDSIGVGVSDGVIDSFNQSLDEESTMEVFNFLQGMETNGIDSSLLYVLDTVTNSAANAFQVGLSSGTFTGLVDSAASLTDENGEFREMFDPVGESVLGVEKDFLAPDHLQDIVFTIPMDWIGMDNVSDMSFSVPFTRFGAAVDFFRMLLRGAYSIFAFYSMKKLLFAFSGGAD